MSIPGINTSTVLCISTTQFCGEYDSDDPCYTGCHNLSVVTIRLFAIRKPCFTKMLGGQVILLDSLLFDHPVCFSLEQRK